MAPLLDKRLLFPPFGAELFGAAINQHVILEAFDDAAIEGRELRRWRRPSD